MLQTLSGKQTGGGWVCSPTLQLSRTSSLFVQFSWQCTEVLRLNRTEERLKEKMIGGYNFASFYEEANHLPQPLLDHASFSGGVEVRNSPGRGRGLFTTVPVKAGDLLVCEKAFALSYTNEKDTDGASSKNPQAEAEQEEQRKAKSEVMIAKLYRMIVQKLAKNPSLFPEFVSLYSGLFPSSEKSRIPLIVDDRLVIDT
jgi:hypothetical protein